MPRKIGSVRLVEEIGRGGMGVVYRGWDEVLHRSVALKVLPGLFARKDDPQFGRFFGGARAEAAVKHPNIVPVYEAGHIDGIPCLIMEYVDGPSLRTLTKLSQQFSLSVAVKILMDVAQGASALHERDIIHRDLKPANTLISSEGRVLVTDFGLASLRQQSEGTTAAAGTPTYMAPETFAGKPSLQADVYAMGIMLFELLAGQLPFSGTLTELRDQHADAPLPVDQLPVSTPGPLIEVMERATHKDQMFRYRNAGRFVSALQSSVATGAILVEGAAELKEIVFKHLASGSVSPSFATGKEPSTSTYFEQLAELAQKKRTTPVTPPQPVDSNEQIGSGKQSPHDESSQATLRVDIPCVQCGYNLRSLPADGRCPECSEAVPSSLRSDRLFFADKSWLKRIRWGIILLFVGVPATFFLSSLSFTLLQAFVPEKGIAGSPVVVIISFGSLAVFVIATFLATAPVPTQPKARFSFNIRRIARMLGLLVPFWLVMARIIPVSVVVIAMTATIALFLLHLARFSDCIPDKQLSRRTRTVALVLSALVPCSLVPWSLRSVIGGAGVDAVAMVLTAACITTLVVIWGLLRVYSRSIKEVIAGHVPYDTLFGGAATEATRSSTETGDLPPDESS